MSEQQRTGRESDRCPQLTADHLCMRKMELGKILFHWRKGQCQLRKTTRAEDAVKCIEGDENNKALLSYVLLCLFVCVENVDFYAYFSI